MRGLLTTVACCVWCTAAVDPFFCDGSVIHCMNRLQRQCCTTKQLSILKAERQAERPTETTIHAINLGHASIAQAAL